MQDKMDKHVVENEPVRGAVGLCSKKKNVDIWYRVPW